MLKCFLCILLIYIGSTNACALRSEENVYQIATAQDLQAFARLVNGGQTDACACLLADIDYRSYTTTVGLPSVPYRGTFDGCCHRVSVQFESDSLACALFPHIGEGGTVKSLLIAGTLIAHAPQAAGIAGILSGGTIRNCFAHVDIVSDCAGPCAHGGLVGEARRRALIVNSAYSGRISAPRGGDVGGLVGLVSDSDIVIRNSLTICDADLAYYEGSNTVARSVEVACHDVYYLHAIGTTPAGATQITPAQIESGEILYRIFGSENYAETLLSYQKSSIYQNVLAYVGLWFMVFIMTASVLITGLYYYKDKQLHYQFLYEKALKEHTEWENRLRAFNAPKPSSLTPSSAPLGAAQRSTLGERDVQHFENPSPTELSSPVGEGSGVRPARLEGALESLYSRLLAKMEQERLYIDPELDEPTVASLMCSNKSYISECISRYSDQPNFNTWLAHYRIHYAIQILEDNPVTDIKSLYLMSGFKNHTSFTRHFKNIVGLTAMQYARMIQERVKE